MQACISYRGEQMLTRKFLVQRTQGRRGHTTKRDLTFRDVTQAASAWERSSSHRNEERIARAISPFAARSKMHTFAINVENRDSRFSRCQCMQTGSDVAENAPNYIGDMWRKRERVETRPNGDMTVFSFDSAYCSISIVHVSIFD